MPPRTDSDIGTYRQVVHTGTGLQKTAAEYCKDKNTSLEKRLTGQTDRTHEANINNILVAKAGSAEIDSILCGDGNDVSNRRWRKVGHLYALS